MEKEPTDNFVSPFNKEREKMEIPVSTLRDVIEKAEGAAADLASFLESDSEQIPGKQARLSRAFLMSALSKVSYIVGAVSYYIGDNE